MNIRQQTEIIAGYYRDLRDYSRSEDYSRSDQTVYIAPDNRHWLVVDWKHTGTVQARLSDDKGVVVAWDTYSTQQAEIRLVEAVRRSEDGKGQVMFTPDEIAVIHQFADGSRAGTTAMLRTILPQIKDDQTRQIVEQTAEKMERLPESDCEELITTTKMRMKMENERGIQQRLASMRKQERER